MSILVTAFEPFGGESVNPAQQAVARLPRTIAGVEVVTLVVPTVFEQAGRLAIEAIETHHPDVVLCVGQAGGRAAVTPERVAINLADAPQPDNAGDQPVDRPVVKGGPAAHFATLPVKAMVNAIREVGVPASLSNTAGTFVCNHIMYSVLHHLAEQGSSTRAGFVHVPFTDEQVAERPGVPSLALDEIVRALEAAIGAAVTHDADLGSAEGALD